jgi:uncharacterized YccA/Bax inhibitor family protein
MAINNRNRKKSQPNSFGVRSGYNRLIREFSLNSSYPSGAFGSPKNNPYATNPYDNAPNNYTNNYPGQYNYNNYDVQSQSVNPYSTHNLNQPNVGYNQYGQPVNADPMYNVPQNSINSNYPQDYLQSNNPGYQGNLDPAYGFQGNRIPNVNYQGSPVSDAKPFVAVDTFNKVLQLTLVALFFGVITFTFPVNSAVLLIPILVGFVLGMVTLYKPRLAKYLAPVYAAVEGLVLGTIANYYSVNGNYVAPIAIIGTAAIFVGVLTLYRTGLVKVTPRFLSMTMVGSFSLLAIMIASILLPISYLQSNLVTFIVFGLLYLVIAIMNLFADFNLIYSAEAQGVSAEGEWYGAFLIMMSLVMTFLALLRIFGGGGRR